jgi:hypothetical protein
MSLHEERPEGVRHKPRLLDLFEVPNLRARLRAVLRGLRAPRESGDHKRAIQELQRLYAVAAGLLAPCLALLILLTASARFEPTEEDPVTVFLEPKAAPPDPEPPPPPPPPPDDVTILQPGPPGPIVANAAPGPVLPDQTPLTNPDSPERPPIVSIAHAPISVLKLPGAYTPRGKKPGTGVSGSGAGGASDAAILRALRWLKRNQESDGAWRTGSGGGPADHAGAAPAMTGLALLTYLGHGEMPDSAEFGDTVRRGMTWLVENQGADGRFRGADAHDYSHPIATYALAESFGMTRIPFLRPVAERALDVLLEGQHPSGLWDYNCRPGNRDDLSYSGWCVQALRAASIAGLQPEKTRNALRRAAAGLRTRTRADGLFQYVADGAASDAMTAVGTLCRQIAGGGHDTGVRAGLAQLERATCNWKAPWTSNPLYAWYYVTQAKFHDGGKGWPNWSRDMRREFVGSQIVERGAGVAPGGTACDLGHWIAAAPSELGKSRVYCTTLCALTLEVESRVLPSYKEPAGDDEIGLPAEKDEIKIRTKSVGAG